MKTKNVNKSTEKSESKKKGKLISFGGLHLMLTLTLPDDHFDNKEVKFDEMNSLKELSFLKEDKELWNNIILTSNNDTINLLLQANVPFARKVIVDYVVMNKISFTEEQQEFKEMIMSVMKANSIQVIENEVCNCNIAILLYVKWKEQIKSYSLCNETHFASKEEKEEEEIKKEKEKEDEKTKPSNTNKSISNKNDNELNVENEPQNKEEIQKQEEKEQMNEDQKKEEPDFLRENSKIVQPPQQETNTQPPKAQMPPEEEGKQEENHEEKKQEDCNKQGNDSNPFVNMEVQCDSYEYILINLCDYTKGELGTSVTLKNLLSFFLDLKANSNIKIVLNTINSLPPTMTNEDMQTFEYILQVVDFIFGDKKETIHLFQALHEFHKDQAKFEKKQYLNVFYNHIASRSLSKSKHKIALYLDEFNRLQIAESNGSKKHQVTELDATLYPKINHYNHKTVEEYKKLILDQYLMYSILFVGAFVGKLIQGSMDSKTIYSAYLTAIESVKKIVELNKNGLEKPRDQSFYIVKLLKGKINEKIGQDMLQSKEKSFVLDCINEQKSKLKYYNPLFDSHLTSFFSCETNRKELKTKGFINTKGFIMYDSTYRDLLGGSKQRRRGEKPNENMLIKTINNINVGEYYPSKEVNAEEQVLRQTSPLPKKLPKIQDNYTQYSRTNNSRRLPPLRTSGNYSSSNTKPNQKTSFCETEVQNNNYERKDNMGDN